MVAASPQLWRRWSALLLAFLPAIGDDEARFACPTQAPWPSRLSLPVRPGWTSSGFTADGRSFLVSRSRGAGEPAEFMGYDLSTGAIQPDARPAPVRGMNLHPSHAGTMTIQEDQALDPVTRGWNHILLWLDSTTRAVRQSLPIAGYHIRLLHFAFDDRSARIILDRDFSTSPAPAGLPTTKVLTWDLVNGGRTERPVATPPGEFLAYSADGRTSVALDRAQGGVQFWDVDTGRPLVRLIPTDGDLATNPIGIGSPITISRDSRWLGLVHRDGRASVFDLTAARRVATLRIHPPGRWYAFPHFSPDGRFLLSSGLRLNRFAFGAPAGLRPWAEWLAPGWCSWANQEVIVADIAAGRVVARLPGAIQAWVAPDSRSAVVHTADGRWSVRDLPRSEAK